MNKKLTFPLILMIFLLGNHIEGQTLRAFEKKAEESYVSRDYTAALAYHKQLLEIDSNRVDASFYAGESARQIRAYEIAERHFENIPDSSKTGFYATTDFRLANVKKGLEKYDEAIVHYQKFIENNPDSNNLFTKRAIEELDYCEWALEVMADSAKTEIFKLDTMVNTLCIDFAPFKKDGKLFYSSADNCESEDDAPASRVFTWNGRSDKILWEELKSPFDSLRHVSNVTYSPDGLQMYYTLCKDDADYAGEYDCEIYYHKLDKYGKLKGSPKRLPDNINQAGTTTTQPSFGKNAKGEAVIYFVSDRAYGKGGLDIWSSKLTNNGSYEEPINVSELNTVADDVTPFYHYESKTLFFSSEGHQTLGGFDIFKSNVEGTKWGVPENRSYPTNSSYDDLYYAFFSKDASFYLASNRPGSMCDAPEKGCTCTDIYEGSIFVDLRTLVYNVIDSSALEGVTVELKDLTNDIVDKVTLNENGNLFTFPLKIEREYLITATKNEYESASTTVDTRGLIESTSFNRKLYLRPKIGVIVLTYDAITKEPLMGTTIQLLHSQSQKDSVVFLPETTNETFFEIDFKQDYQVTGAKLGYISARDSFNTHPFTTPTLLTEKLYLTPFNLPITLYFDNDKPRYVNRADTTTRLSYETTYNRYLLRRETFKAGYSRNLAPDAKLVAQNEVDNFFDNEVIKGWNDFEEFARILRPYLESGNSIEIIVEGYASPLAPGDYNRRLTGRRISSVINQLRKFEEGALSPFLDSGKLIIKEEPKGEEDADKEVSDSGNDRRSSVYSPKASEERRVRILDVKKQDNAVSFINRE